MKVKVIYEGQHVILDIPASKFLVLRERRTEDVSYEIIADCVRVVEDRGDVVEIPCDSDGQLVLFFNPVWVTDFAPTEYMEYARVSCGWAIWVGAPNYKGLPDGHELEQKYLRTESGFSILTTPRAIMQLTRMSESAKSDHSQGNYRCAVALGSRIWDRARRIPEELLENLLTYTKVDREEGKDYSEHGLESCAEWYTEASRRDTDWIYSPNRESKGYWNNVDLFWLFVL